MRLRSFLTISKNRKEADIVIVEKIDPLAFPGKVHSKGRVEAPEMTAVRRLQMGEAIRFPCRWDHTSTRNNVCAGYNAAHSAANREGIDVIVRCREQFVHVMRVNKA